MNEYSTTSGNGGKSSDQIKADIERTRSEMTEKIDTIQDRLSPDNLKMQAQTMVQDIMQESADAITDFLKTSAQQAGQTLVETVKKNPLPSAVLGLGLGWLLMNTMNNQRGESDDRSRGYEMGDRMGYRSDMGYGQGSYGRSGYSQGGYGQEYGRGMGQGSMIGARASYTGDYGYEEWQESDIQYNDNRGGGFGDKAGDMAGKVGRTAKDAAGKVGDTVGGAAQNIAGSVAGAVQGAAGAVQDAAGSVADTVSGAAQSIAGKVGDTAGSMAQQGSDLGQQARHQAMSAGRQMTRQAGSLAGQTQHQAARAGRTMQRTLEDNPVAFGAAALLAGIAVGLALPATRQERQMFGDVRDQVMDKAQSMASSFTEQAKQVVEEVRPRLEETAQKVVEDLKASGSLTADELMRTGKQAGEEIKQTLKETGTTVKSRVEDTTGIKLNTGSEGGEGSQGSQGGQGAMQDDQTEIVSGLVVEGEESQTKPNVGGSYDSKFDNKS